MVKQRLSYEEISSTQPEELERLALARLLDDATLARIAHLGRFFARIAELCPAATKVGDVFTEQELQAIWRDTAASAMRTSGTILCSIEISSP
jgi:hypothetical protein